MASVKHCDLCILGGGGAGVAAARAAAVVGAKVVVVEKRSLGGAYLSQIIPAQAFCTAALDLPPPRDPSATRPPTAVEFLALRARVAAAIKDFSREYAANALSAQTIDIIRAVGSFSRPTQVEAGGQLIEANNFILATGATPATPAFPGWELVRPLALEDLWRLDRPPTGVIILGATFLGLTLAQAFRRLGTTVTLIDEGPILGGEDPELAAPVLTNLARDGVQIYANTEIAGVEPGHVGIKLVLKGHSDVVESERILFAGDASPLLEGLGLNNAGVTYDNSGILADAGCRTSNRHVYVAGNAAGTPGAALTGVGQAARLAQAVVIGGRLKTPPIRVLATDPELATVGLGETRAREKYHQIRVLRSSLAATARARLEGHTVGHVKIITNSAGIVVGAGVVGLEAREFIGVFALAIANKTPAADLDLVANAPAFAEAATRAALACRPQLSKSLSLRTFLPPWIRW